MCGHLKWVLVLIWMMVGAARAQGPGKVMTTSGASQASATEAARFFSEPIKALTIRQGIDAFDALARIIVGSLDYQADGKGHDKAEPLGGGVVKRLMLRARAPEGRPRPSLELLLIKNPYGGLSLSVTGRADSADPSTADPGNPQLAFVRDQIHKMNNGQQTSSPLFRRADLAMEVYALGYSDADRTLGLLKALQYQVVEYASTAGAGPTYTPSTDLSATFGKSPSLPIIVKFVDVQSQGLSLASLWQSNTQTENLSIPDLTGQALANETVGDPSERLLIIYDPSDPEPYVQLLDLLRNKIDVPARQIIIEALVIEIDSDKLRDLGATYSFDEHELTGGFSDSTGLTFSFDRFPSTPSPMRAFKATINALVTSGEAELLSKPSVLVLDGRQARIQIGQQVPILTSSSTAAGGNILTANQLFYMPIGIMLNLRPRISRDGTDVTMQVEVVVSSIQALNQTSLQQSLPLVPTIDSRHVQSQVRVADDTPFIIGGLIRSDMSRTRAGIPGFSRIPILGALFRKTRKSKTKKEVIIVMTPHVTSKDTRKIAQVIPKNAEVFESIDNRLFPNTYRFRGSDLFDLGFIQSSEEVVALREKLRHALAEHPRQALEQPYAAWTDGKLPGEDIFIRRMLCDVILKNQLQELVNEQQIVYLGDSGGAAGIRFLSKELAAMGETHNTLSLRFHGNTGQGAAATPGVMGANIPELSFSFINPSGYAEQLRRSNSFGPNKGGNTLLLNRDVREPHPPMALLRGIFVLERMLALNPTLPMSLQDLHAGREIVFPSREELKSDFFILDEKIAHRFFEMANYYEMFRETLDREVRDLEEALANN